MDLDLGGILNLPLPANDGEDDVQRLIAILTQMQEGHNVLTEIVAGHQARIEVLERENRLLRARTDPVKRSTILMTH